MQSFDEIFISILFFSNTVFNQLFRIGSGGIISYKISLNNLSIWGTFL